MYGASCLAVLSARLLSVACMLAAPELPFCIMKLLLYVDRRSSAVGQTRRSTDAAGLLRH